MTVDRALTVADADRALADVELQMPVTMQDCTDVRAMLVDRVALGMTLDVTLRGTPDRRHDGQLRVEVRIGEHYTRSLVVHPSV